MDIVEKKFGQLLKLERERRQLDLAAISTELKIPEHNLEGIEKGDLSLLPSVIYYNLFARSYAQHLGIDYVRTLDAIKVEAENAGSDAETDEVVLHSAADDDEFEDSEAAAAADKGKNKRIVGILAIALLLLLSYAAVDKLFLADAANHDGTSYLIKDLDESRLASLSGFNWNKTDYNAPTEIKLRLIPRRESWSTVLSDGDTAIFRRLIPGRVYEATARYRLVITIGAPSAVDVEINGKHVNIRDAVSRRISRVEINQVNLDSFLNRKESGSVSPNPGLTVGPVSHEGLQGRANVGSRNDTTQQQETATQDER